MADIRELIKALIAGPESGGNMRDKKGNLLKNQMGSSALGKYQITNDTWNLISNQHKKKTGKTLQRDSLQDNEIAMNVLLENYQKDLKANGVPINPTTLYAMHFQGNAKWVKAAIKNPNLPARAVFSSNAIIQNPTYIKSADAPLGSIMQALDRKVRESAKNQKIPLSNFNTQKPSAMDEETRKALGLDKIPQYSSPKGIWDTWKAYKSKVAWINKNKGGDPALKSELIKEYSNKGYITRGSDGSPSGPFNTLIIDKLRADEKKANGGLSTDKKSAQELFNVANNMNKILSRGFMDGGKQRYSTSDNGQNLSKENVFTSDELTPAQKKVVDGIMKSYSKNGKRNANQTFVNEKGTSAYNTVEFLKAMETNLNKYLPEEQKLNLIDEKTGKRGKDLAFNTEVASHLGKSGKISAASIYIPAINNASETRNLRPTESLLPESNYDYIDPGYDEISDNDGGADFSWEGGNYGGPEMPTEPTYGNYTPPKFNYVDPDIKNSPEYEKFKKIAKINNLELTNENLGLLKSKLKEYEAYEEKNDLNSFMNNLDNLYNNIPDNNNKGYDPKSQKGDGFPLLETASSLMGILNGNNLSDTDLPRRNEEISQLFLNHTADLKKLSQIGLKPEDEAYAKNQLAESSQASIDLITRASNGNRNLILGNLGRVDYQKQKGLLDLAVADSKAKTEALYKYGEAVKYISDFDANKSITQNERDYDNAMRSKEAGGRLTAQAWKGLMDNIDYYKNNKPGSANAMLKSHYLRTIYDVDPNETNPNNYYHPDQYAKRVAEQNAYKESLGRNREILNSLNDSDKENFKSFVEKNGMNFNDEKSTNYLNFLKNNPGEKGQMDITKFGDANATGDYSIMFSNMPKKEITPTSVEQAKIKETEQNQPEIFKSSIPQNDPNSSKINSQNSSLPSIYQNRLDGEQALIDAGLFGSEMIDKNINNSQFNFL